MLLRKGSINDKVSIIGDHRARLHFCHTQAETRLTVGKDMWGAHVREIGEDFGVSKGDDFDRNSFSPLCGQSIEFRAIRKEPIKPKKKERQDVNLVLSERKQEESVRTVVPRISEFLR